MIYDLQLSDDIHHCTHVCDLETPSCCDSPEDDVDAEAPFPRAVPGLQWLSSLHCHEFPRELDYGKAILCVMLWASRRHIHRGEGDRGGESGNNPKGCLAEDTKTLPARRGLRSKAPGVPLCEARLQRPWELRSSVMQWTCSWVSFFLRSIKSPRRKTLQERRL